MSFPLALLVSALGGFVALSYEILWYRVISFTTWSQASGFGLLLAAYLLGIALGSRISGRFCKDDATVGDTKSLPPLAAFALLANLVAWLVVPGFGWLSILGDWRIPLVLVAISAGLLGAILPLVSHFGIKADERAGVNLSYVYLANIVGSTTGSLVTGFVFMDVWPIRTIGLAIAAVGFVLVAVLFVGAKQDSKAALGSLGSLAVITGVVVALNPIVYEHIYEKLHYKKGYTPQTEFADILETKSGVITVTQDGTVYGGGAYDGRFNTQIGNARNGILRGYAIGGMHPSPKQVLMIGLASGSWAEVVANLPGIEHLTIVEINPGYLKLIAKHPEVAGILTNPKVTIVTDDGRRWLNRNPEARFDFIAMNTTWHWRAHNTNLLSVEFMNLARKHMNTGGILYFNTTSSHDVLKTAATTFPHAMRVYNFIAVSDSPITFDKSRWKSMLETMKIEGRPILNLNDKDDKELFDGLVDYADTINAPPVDNGLEGRDSLLKNVADGNIVTDDNMLPEWQELFRFPSPL